MLKILAIATILPLTGMVAATPARPHVTVAQDTGAPSTSTTRPPLSPAQKAWFGKAVEHLLQGR